MVSDSFIPYGRQDVTDEDVLEVERVLRSEFLTQGQAVPLFEEVLAEYCDATSAICVNSATSALHLACLALELGSDDILWTSPITFVASANCARYCGARVDFVDIDPTTYNMCARALETKLKEASAIDALPKIVVPVHMAGQSCDMKKIRELGEEYGFKIIEDASHAIGASFYGKMVGGCHYSDIAVFSFHPVKIVTSGEGGAALTRDPKLARKMAQIRAHGITKDPTEHTEQSSGAWYYEQHELGFNYRMTDIHAALGRNQMKRVDTYVEKRNEIASRYSEALADTNLGLPYVAARNRSSFHLYIIQVKDGVQRRKTFDHLRAANIGVNVHYIPVHMQPYYRRLGFVQGDYPVAEAYYEKAISLPIYPTLTERQQQRVIDELESGLQL